MFREVRVISKSTSMIIDPIRFGVAGLGRGFSLTAPSALNSQFVKFVAAVAPREESRIAFIKAFGGQVYASFDDLIFDDEIEAIHIATPHQMHAQMTIKAAEAGKHVLVEKPIAISLKDAKKMVDSCASNNVVLIVGPAHSFDAPILTAKQLLEKKEFGSLLSINTMNYTDFLYRPRRDEELRTEDGGGVLFSQGAHQFDIIRFLSGSEALQVFAYTGRWDQDRNTEVSYQALIKFENGVTAQCTYSGYGHFDSDELQDWISETGYAKDPMSYGRSRKALIGISRDEELEAKRKRTFDVKNVPPVALSNEHFGPLFVQCERADLRIGPTGIAVYGDFEKKFIAVPMISAPRNPVLEAVYNAVRFDKRPIQSGRWCIGTLELCHAVLTSSNTGQPVNLNGSKKISY